MGKIMGQEREKRAVDRDRKMGKKRVTTWSKKRSKKNSKNM